MKKILYILFFVVLVGGLITVAILASIDHSVHFIACQNSYSYVYTPVKKMQFPIYRDQLKHELTNSASYQDISLSDQSDSQKISVELERIDDGGSEFYNKIQYYAIILVIPMPNIGTNIAIDDCFLNIRLINNENYRFKVGSLSLYYYANVGVESAINIQTLDGAKGANPLVSRLEKISIGGIMPNYITLTSIEVNHHTIIEYAWSGDTLILTLSYEEATLFNTPIIIHYQEGGVDKVQVVDNFTYFQDYEILMNSAPAVNVY